MLDMVPRIDSRETKTDTLSFTIFDTLSVVIIPDKSFSNRSVVENDEICVLFERNLNRNVDHNLQNRQFRHRET